MFKVSTVNLSPAADAADASFGSSDSRELDAASLAALLEKFEAIDSVQNHLHDPQVLIQARDTRFIVRTSNHRLQLYNALDTSQPGAELTLPALLETLGAATRPVAAPGEAEPELLDLAPRRRHQGLLAATLLLLGLGLNAWGVYQFLHHDEDPPPPAITPISDEGRLTVLRQQLAGTYATGNEAGSRVIIVSADGTIKFHLLAVVDGSDLKPANETADTYVFGQRSDGSQCLATLASDQIDIGSDGSLNYYGDTYQRITPAK